MNEPRTTTTCRPASRAGFIAADRLAKRIAIDPQFVRALARAARVPTMRGSTGDPLIDKKAFMRLVAD